MSDCRGLRNGRFRVWIVTYAGTPPTEWHAVPAQAVAVAPAERGTMSARNARLYVETFNRAAVRMQPREQERRRWAVAIPIVVRYEGEPCVGQSLE